MAQVGRTFHLRLLAYACLLAGAGGGWAVAQPVSATAPADVDQVTYVISLAPLSGRSTAEDRARASELALILRDRVEPLIAETDYSGFEVEVLPDWDQTAAAIRQGGSQVIECDPVLYFVTVASRDSLRARYEVFLQSVADPMPRGEVLVPEGAGITGPDDLQGRRIAFVHRFAGGAAQIQRALNERGLSANRDYSVWHAGYVENAFLNLKEGLVDGVAMSSLSAAEYAGRGDLPNLVPVLETEEILPPLFARRRSDVDRFPALSEAVAGVLRSFSGPDQLVPADTDFYERTREESVPWE